MMDCAFTSSPTSTRSGMTESSAALRHAIVAARCAAASARLSPPGARQRRRKLVVTVVPVVVHLAQDEVIRLGVERPVVGLGAAGLALPERRGVHPPRV